MANIDHGLGIVVCQYEGRKCQGCAFHEQSNRLICGQFLKGGSALFWQRKGWYLVSCFPAYIQYCPAGSKDVYVWTTLKQDSDQLSTGFQQVLTIIENEQSRFLAQNIHQYFGDWTIWSFSNIERRSNGLRN